MTLSINTQRLFQGYLNLGVPANGAAALAGVQSIENGPGALPNPGGDAAGVFGISQWTPNASNMARYNDALNGIPQVSDTGSLNDLDAQQQYTLSEMQASYPQSYAAIMNPNASVGSIASTVTTNYEGPANPGPEINLATNQGNQVLAQYNANPTPSPTVSITDASGGTATDQAGSGGNGANLPSTAGAGTGSGYLSYAPQDQQAAPSTAPAAGTIAPDDTTTAADQSTQQGASTLGSQASNPSSIVSGIFEYVGATAVSQAGNVQATATNQAAQLASKTSQQDTASLNKTATQNAQATNKTNTADTASLTTTATNIASAAISDVYNLFGRGAVAVVGLVFIAAALFLFATPEGRQVASAANNAASGVGRSAKRGLQAVGA
ncbi:MAG: phage tail tip lysozyme [Methylocella sp.]